MRRLRTGLFVIAAGLALSFGVVAFTGAAAYAEPCPNNSCTVIR